MKTTTEKKVHELYQMISESNQFLKQDFLNKIKEIIACESNGEMFGKLDLYDLTVKDKLRPVFECVHYIGGYVYVTDGFILLRIKKDYPADMEGKSIRKDGTTATDINVPRFERVLQAWSKDYEKHDDYVIEDFGRVVELLKMAKAHKKIYKKDAECVIKLRDRLCVDAFRFSKFCNVLKHFGVNKIKVGDFSTPIKYMDDNIVLVLMPYNLREDYDETTQVQQL